MNDKVNINCGQHELPNYINLNKLKNPSDDYKCSTIPDNSVNELIINHGTLEQINKNELIEYVKNWYRILSPTGQIKVYYGDINILTNNLLYKKISLEDYEGYLYKNGFVSMYDYNTVNNIMLQNNFKLINSYYSNYIGIIHGSK